MASRVELSENEIIEALREAKRNRQPDPPGVFVVSELARKSKQSPRTIRTQIEVLRKQGRIETMKVQREGSDGRQTYVPAYRILREAR